MVLLPRGNPVKENVNPGKVNLPEALDKLRQGKFTGFLCFDFPVGTGLFLFDAGRFIDARFESAHDSLLTRSAISRVFVEALKLNGLLNIYRTSPQLAVLLHGVLNAELIHQGQELELINVRGLLKRLRDEQLNGCIRVYGKGRTVLIFYRSGRPIGFFHEGAAELEVTADCGQSVARMAGAKLDVLSAAELPDRVDADLWGAENLVELWQQAQGEAPSVPSAVGAVPAGPAAVGQVGSRQALLLGGLRRVAQQYLGAFGGSLVEKEFAGLANGPLDEARLADFFAKLAQAAELVIDAGRVEQMLAEMKQGARNVLAGR